MPHSLRDIELPSYALDPSGSVELDIEINDPIKLFSPGNIVSGYVLSRDDGNLRNLNIEFLGRSTASFYAAKKPNGSKLHYADDVILFSYKRPLNEKYQPGGEWLKNTHWRFEFRFPSTTENRRTVFYQQALQGQCRDSVHPLPPSLVHRSALCTFTVEYVLRARAYGEKRLMAETELPLHFVSTRAADPYTPLHSPCSPRSSWGNTYGIMVQSNELNTALPFRNRSIDGLSSMTIYPPVEIVIGQKMSIQAEVRFSGLPDMAKMLGSSLDIRIEKLQLLYSVSCRGKVQGEISPLETHLEDIGRVSTTVKLDVEPPNSTIEVVDEYTFAFCIEAPIPDHMIPSFASFLVCNRYDLHARIVAEVQGRVHRTLLVIEDVQVVSLARAILPARKSFAPAVIGPVPAHRH
jgi:hypothetical protein